MKGNKLPLILGAILVIAALALFLMPKEQQKDVAAVDGKVKVGFVYLTNPGDHGWTYAHEVGRQDVEKHFGSKVETTYVENVPEGPDSTRVIRELARQGNNMIFTTSFGYMDPTLKVAEEFPDVKFVHLTGYKRSGNMATGNIRFYEGRYVQGVVAGMMTKSNKIGQSCSILSSYQRQRPEHNALHKSGYCPLPCCQTACSQSDEQISHQEIPQQLSVLDPCNQKRL